MNKTNMKVTVIMSNLNLNMINLYLNVIKPNLNEVERE